MGKDLCKINIKSVKMYLLIDKLVKIYVFKFFSTSDICHFGLASLTEEP